MKARMATAKILVVDDEPEAVELVEFNLKQAGFSVDRGTMFRGVTLVSVPVLSPSWGLLLILTAAGHSHDLVDDTVGGLSRALQSVAGRLSDSLPLLRLG